MSDTKDLTFRTSTLETIDYALYEWVNKKINLFYFGIDSFTKVRVVWTMAERAFLSKNQNTRDAEGALDFPIISIQRTAVEKNMNRKGSAWANIDAINDAKGGSIDIARRINQDKTSFFSNSDAKRRFGQKNFPYKTKKVVYETISIPMPVYVTLQYNINVKTLYQQQMNEIVQPFLTKTGAINYFIIEKDGNKYESFLDESFEIKDNVSNLSEEERVFETSFKVNVLGYLIGGDKNENRPKIVVRENVVDVKIGKEETIVKKNSF